MFTENFFIEVDDEKIDSWLDENLGKEVFSPNQARLEKYFSNFKESFKKQDIPIIIIAGTNGKGEVALSLESMLVKAEQETFLWMSPHVVSVRERFSYNGFPISSEELLELFISHSEKSNELSYYEFLFLCFCDWVSKKSSKNAVIVFEVGLGGRLDATNFFDADLAALVSVGRDHIEILGPTLTDVLKEKAAVGRRGQKLISAVSQEFLIKELTLFCENEGINLLQLDLASCSSFKDINKVVAQTLFLEFCNLVNKRESGIFPRENLWARPFEVTYKSTQFILVGSHNLDGLRHLANWVNRSRTGQSCENPGEGFQEVWVGMSRRPGEELDQCLKLIELSPCLGKEVSLFEFEHPRATSLEDLRDSWAKLSQGRKVRFEKGWQNRLQNTQGPKKILVCGSYYFIGELLRKGPFLKRP